MLISFFFFSLNISAQIFESKLIDTNTQEGIDNAFIFISNSSISALSEEDGTFIIDRSVLPNSEIVISHLNYETKYLQPADMESTLDTIYLNPTNHSLEEVVLKSKKSKKRKKWLEKFTTSLLGSTKNASQSKLLNPEAVLFTEVDNSLTAIAEEHLIFRNEKLGYNILFLLEEFSLEKNDDVTYIGKIFFEEFKTVNATQMANRKEVFVRSSRKFFKDYAAGSHDTLQYSVALATLEGNGFFHYVGEMERKNLISFDKDRNLIQLKFRRFLRIENKAVGSNQKVKNTTVGGFGNISVQDAARKKAKNKQDLSEYAVSYLKSKSDIIIVNKEGVIQNQKDIVEYGYWSELRLADRLPDDFQYVSN